LRRLPAWRIAAASLILLAMAFLLAKLGPIYFRNMELQSYVAVLTQGVENQTKSDDVLRTLVLDQAARLTLPVMADNVHINRSPAGTVQRIDVRYFVEVNLPGYTVNLHFYPGAGSR
jgi:hypothetical protein